MLGADVNSHNGGRRGTLFASLSEPVGDPEDQLTAESQGPPEDLADSPLNDVPPPTSVDDMIFENLGNIFRKNTTRNPIMQGLLDRQSEVDLHRLAAELREFADTIRASANPN